MYLSQPDWHTALVSIFIIATCLVFIEIAVKKHLFTKAIGRKLLHLIAISTCAYGISNFEDKKTLACILLGFFFILLWIVRKGWMQVDENKTYGIAFFPLAFSILLLIPSVPNPVIVFATLTLGISDAVAGLTGLYFGKPKITFLFEAKSWVGFVAFYLSCFFLSLLYFKLFSITGIFICALLALLPALTELFSWKGSDNLTVPLVTAFWTILILPLSLHQLQLFSIVVLLLILLSYGAVYKKWLTVSGATAAAWMGLLLYQSGGFEAFFSPGLFLLSGSFLTKLNKHPGEKNGRNGVQVFANGIIGIGCMVFYKLIGGPVYLFAALLSFSISMSDSVSSELGTFLKGYTVDIFSFRKASPGASGGISLSGTFFGLSGALLSALTGPLVYGLNWCIFLWIAIGGFAGMLLDSMLGSLLQKKYRNESGEMVDEPGKDHFRIKGYDWCNNDAVNILSNAAITALFILLYQ